MQLAGSGGDRQAWPRSSAPSVALLRCTSRSSPQEAIVGVLHPGTPLNPKPVNPKPWIPRPTCLLGRDHFVQRGDQKGSQCLQFHQADTGVATSTVHSRGQHGILLASCPGVAERCSKLVRSSGLEQACRHRGSFSDWEVRSWGSVEPHEQCVRAGSAHGDR